MAGKSVAAAYALWFTFGLFGAHQFYLRRDRHAFCMWATLGALGVGWLRDLWRIPEYVADANDAPDHIEWLTEQMRKRAKPKVSIARWLAQTYIGALFGYLVYFAVPLELYETQGATARWAVLILAHVAAALGVHTVGNVGRHQLSFKSCLMGSLLAIPLTYDSTGNMLSAGLIGTIVANNVGLDWRRSPAPVHGLCRRLLVLALCGGVYQGMWLSALYYNAAITTADGESVKLRDAAHNFFNSKAWNELSDVVHRLYHHFKANGLWYVWSQLMEALDPLGEQHAYEVLGLEKGATQEQITSVYRKLVRQWHPDKAKDPLSRKEAQEKFVEIQKAYEVLSTLKAKRFQKNQEVPTDAAHER